MESSSRTQRNGTLETLRPGDGGGEFRTCSPQYPPAKAKSRLVPARGHQKRARSTQPASLHTSFTHFTLLTLTVYSCTRTVTQ